MLSIFRSNQLLTSFLLLFYALALNVVMMVLPAVTRPPEGGILFLLVNNLIPATPYWQMGTAAGLLFVQAFMLNFLEYSYRLNRDVNMFAGIFFLLFTAFSPQFQILSPQHFSNIFLFIALFQLMDVSRQNRPEGNIFNAGFFIGIASLFSPASAFYLFLVFIGLNVLRGMILKERIVALTGFIVAYFLAGTFWFQRDALPEFITQQFRDAYRFLDFGKMGPFPWELLPWAIILIGAVLKQGEFFQKQNMLTQKRISLLYWMLFIGLATAIFQPAFNTGHLLLAALPVGFLAAMVFARLRPQWAELWHTLLLLGLLLFQYRTILLKYLS